MSSGVWPPSGRATNRRPTGAKAVTYQVQACRSTKVGPWAQYDVNFDVALAVSALLVLISAALLVTLKWLPFASTSRFRFATSI